MDAKRPIARSVDEYISWYPPATQTILKRLRELVKEIAPDAVESITYAIPTYKFNGERMVYFAAYDSHFSLYPLPKEPDEKLAKDIKSHITGRGTLRFALDKPLPEDLIKRVIKNRLAACM